jgi:hypothetical protein
MLNLVAFDPEYDKEQLQGSFESIRHKDCLEIVMSEAEKNTILLKIKFALTLPERATICFQNLFKLTLPNGHFYIAQCLLNFGFSASAAKKNIDLHEYNFQIVGIADTRVDLGKTLMRRETRIDKTVGRIFGNDIDLVDTKHFNDKYYLVSNTPGVIEKHFDKGFVNTISKYDNLQLMARDREICITFDSEFEEQHAAIVEDIFCNCKFLIPNYAM